MAAVGIPSEPDSTTPSDPSQAKISPKNTFGTAKHVATRAPTGGAAPKFATPP